MARGRGCRPAFQSHGETRTHHVRTPPPDAGSRGTQGEMRGAEAEEGKPVNGERFRLILGSLILIGLISLAAAIALGHVEEKTSFGLTPIMAVMAKVTLDFSQWAFRDRPEQPEETKRHEEPTK